VMIPTQDQNLPEVLILEDDPPTATILKIWLRGICNISMVTDGDATLRLIEAHLRQGRTFDLMLFDINIPFPWNGVSLMQEIKKRWEAYQTIPFVAETAYAMPHDKERILNSGYVDYLPKPLEKQSLIDTLQKHLLRG